MQLSPSHLGEAYHVLTRYVSSYKEDYLDLLGKRLTVYAVNVVESHLAKKKTSANHDVDLHECACTCPFNKNWKLPCIHIKEKYEALACPIGEYTLDTITI